MKHGGSRAQHAPIWLKPFVLLLLPCTPLLSAVAWAESAPESHSGAALGKLELSTTWLEGVRDWRLSVEDVTPLQPQEADSRTPRIRWKAAWDEELTLTNALIAFERPTASLTVALHESTDSFQGLFRPVKGSFGADEAKSVQMRIDGAEASIHTLYRSHIPNPGEDGTLLALQVTGAPKGNGVRARVNQIWVDSGPVPRIRRPTTQPTPYTSRTARRFASVEVQWEGMGVLKELEWGFAQVDGFDQDWRGVEQMESQAALASGALRFGAIDVGASWRAARPDFASPATDDHEIKRDQRSAAFTFSSERLDPWHGTVTRHLARAFDGTDPTYGWEIFTEYDRGRGSNRRQLGMALEWDDPDGGAPLPDVELTGQYGIWGASVKGEFHRVKPPDATVKLEIPLHPSIEVRSAYRLEDRLTRIEILFEPTPAFSLRLVRKVRPTSEHPYLHAETTLAWTQGAKLTVRYGPWDKGHLDWYWSRSPDIAVTLSHTF